MPSDKLFDAMEAGDWRQVDEILATASLTGKELEQKHGEKEDTLLIKAARLGKENVIHMLLNAGAAIDATDKGGVTALIITAQEGHLPALQLLVEKGAAIDVQDIGGITPLIASAAQGHSEVVALLCQRGANIEARTNGGFTALYIAAGQGHLKAVEILLDWGGRAMISHPLHYLCPPLNLGQVGVTPLIISAFSGHSEMVALLCQRGVNIEAQTNGGATALYIAAGQGHLQAVEILLDWGADMEAGDEVGLTPVIASAATGHSEVVALLCQRGANIEARTNGGATALYCASGQGHLKAVEILLDRGAVIEAGEENGFTPVIKAASNGHSEVVALLFDRGANVNARSTDGCSALIVSARNKHAAVVKLLCSKEVVDLDAKDRYGVGALYWENRRPVGNLVSDEVTAVIKGEATWRRVKGFVAFLHIGGLSAADWNAGRVDGGGSMPPSDGTAALPYDLDLPPSGVIQRRKVLQVLENRDLCRIVASFIPKTTKL